MKVKKFLVGAFLASLLTLGGCSGIGDGGSPNYFKEYSFEKEATDEQIEELKDGLKKSLDNLSSYTAKQEDNVNRSLTKSQTTVEGKVKILEDGSKGNENNLIIERTSKAKTSRTEDGVTLKQTEETEYTMWDAGNGYAYNVTKTKRNGDKEAEENVGNPQTVANSKNFKEQYIGYLVPVNQNGDVYVNSDGSYTVVVESNVSKSVTAVQWGKDTKELHQQMKEQVVYTISKDFKLTSGYSYSESKTNRDPETGEWYSSDKVVSYSYTSYKFEYGKRESASVKTLNNSIATKEFIAAEPVINVYQVNAQKNGNSFTITDNLENPTDQRYTNSHSQTAAGDKYTFNASLGSAYSATEFRAQRFEVVLQMLVGTGTEIVEKKVPINLGQVEVDSVDSDYYSIATSSGKTYLVNNYWNESYLSGQSMQFQISFTYKANSAVADRLVRSY